MYLKEIISLARERKKTKKKPLAKRTLGGGASEIYTICTPNWNKQRKKKIKDEKNEVVGFARERGEKAPRVRWRYLIIEYFNFPWDEIIGSYVYV